MNRTFVLIRLSLKQLIWQMARTFGGRKKFSSLLVLLAAAMLIGLSGLYSWAMIESVPAELNMLIPLSMLSAAFGLILVFGFYHAQGYLFDFQDYDLLASMPLTRGQILMSKLVALIAMMLIYSAFLTLPMMALFQLRYAMPATFLLYGLIGQLFLPIVPMSVACLAAVAVRLISSRLKHPVLIRNVLSLGMVIGLMTVMTLFQGQTGQAQDLAALIQPIQTWLAPVYWLTMAMINGNLFALVKLIGLSSLVLILFLLLIAPVWNALNQKARTTPVKAGGKVKLEASSMNAALLRKEHPEITSIVLNVNAKRTSMVLGERNIVLYGKGYIEDTLCGKTFRISPQSFYQVNPVQTEKLYGKAVELAGLTGRERVIDAYCGIGTIGLIASGRAKEVIGVELNRDAVKDAIYNARINGIKNAKFYAGDAGEFMTVMAAEGEKADMLFMDPPRAGSGEAFLSSAVKLGPEKIIYI